MSKYRLNRKHGDASVHPKSKDSQLTHTTETSSSRDRQREKAILKRSSTWWLAGLIVFLSLGVMGAGLKYLEDSAREEKARQKQNPLENNNGLLTSVNPFSPPPTPAPTVQMSKEYIYAGSRTVAVEDAAANAIPPADLAVWRPSNGYWYCMGGVGSQPFTAAWGTNGDKPVQGDYDGDGKTDLAIFRPSATGVWWIYPSSGGSYYTVTLGTSGDIPAQGDYDGDGKTDPAIFRPSTQYWYIVPSSTGSQVSLQFGASSDMPAAADYDGDDKADLAVWRDSEAKFYVYSSSLSQQQTQTLGTSGSAAVPGDYDGDGKTDFAIRHGADWIIRQSSDGQTITVSWFLETNIAVQNDYDGDGKCDIASWKPSGKGVGTWYIRNSHNGSTRGEVWGVEGDIPVPALYRR